MASDRFEILAEQAKDNLVAPDKTRPAFFARQSRRKRPLGLPMDHPVGERRTKIERTEWAEYWRRWKSHVDRHRTYLDRFHRPSLRTTTEAWELLKPSITKILKLTDSGLTDWEILTSAGFVPKYKWLTESDRATLAIAAKQSFVIVVDTFVNAGNQHRFVTVNAVFDALAARFSDHFFESPASTVRDMTVMRARRCRRDLSLNGIQLKDLWEFVTGRWSWRNGQNPLFSARLYRRDGYKVSFRFGSPALAAFEGIIAADTNFAAARRTGFRLLHASKRAKHRPGRRLMSAEHEYNVVEIERESRRLLSLQSRARLLLNVRTFKKDYEAARSEAHRLRELIDQIYDVDATLSDSKRWIPADASTASQRGKRFVRTRIEKGQRFRPIWSVREEDVFNRALYEGLLINNARGYAIESDHLDDDIVNEQMLDDESKWKNRLTRYLTKWRKKDDRPRPPDHWPVSVETLIRAWLSSKDWRRKVRDELRSYDRAHSVVTTFKRVYDDLLDLETNGASLSISASAPAGYVPIRSGFYRVINRRYQPTNFWPTFVSARDIDPEESEAESLSEDFYKSYRDGWFKAWDRRNKKVVGLDELDISSSQTQILAFLLGNHDLEQSTKTSFKFVLAKRVWENKRNLLWQGSKPYCDPEDKEKNDDRLVEFVKTLWMRILYGSSPTYILDELRRKPEIYGPTLSVSSAFEILRAWPEYKPLSIFLDACKCLAKRLTGKAPNAGLTFRDPSDGAIIRWNPIIRSDFYLPSEAQRLTLSLPGLEGEKGVSTPGWPGNWLDEEFFAFSPDANGDYPVSVGKLQNMLAPCIIHVLDAYFSSLVMSGLAQRGVKDFVGIHDCWLVPEEFWAKEGSEWRRFEGKKVLAEVIRTASHDWFQGLEPIYDMFLEHLGDDEEFGTWARALKQRWLDRVQARNFPDFYAPK